jgi:hypothetical protein
MDKTQIFNIIKNQTNYEDDIIYKKMDEFNNDYIKIIKDYMNPNSIKIQEPYQSENQKNYNSIRNLSNVAIKDYNVRKNNGETRL